MPRTAHVFNTLGFLVVIGDAGARADGGRAIRAGTGRKPSTCSARHRPRKTSARLRATLQDESLAVKHLRPWAQTRAFAAAGRRGREGRAWDATAGCSIGRASSILPSAPAAPAVAGHSNEPLPAIKVVSRSTGSPRHPAAGDAGAEQGKHLSRDAQPAGGMAWGFSSAPDPRPARTAAGGGHRNDRPVRGVSPGQGEQSRVGSSPVSTWRKTAIGRRKVHGSRPLGRGPASDSSRGWVARPDHPYAERPVPFGGLATCC